MKPSAPVLAEDLACGTTNQYAGLTCQPDDPSGKTLRPFKFEIARCLGRPDPSNSIGLASAMCAVPSQEHVVERLRSGMHAKTHAYIEDGSCHHPGDAESRIPTSHGVTKEVCLSPARTFDNAMSNITAERSDIAGSTPGQRNSQQQSVHRQTQPHTVDGNRNR